MRFCGWCGKDVALAQPVQPRGEVRTSGKATASMVLGFFFWLLPAAILAIIFGHISLGEIKRSAGRLKGEGMAIAGLVLGYIGGAAVPLILIMAAIAIPNLLRSRVAANQASAVGSLRTINTAEITYAATYNKGYSPRLATLGLSLNGNPDADAAGLLDNVLASGIKSGYTFTYEPGETDASGRIASYTVRADPLTQGTTGVSHYFADESGVIRQETEGPASKGSPPIAQ
jgi:type II secretory pathway pseudopilin PulG